MMRSKEIHLIIDMSMPLTNEPELLIKNTPTHPTPKHHSTLCRELNVVSDMIGELKPRYINIVNILLYLRHQRGTSS